MTKEEAIRLLGFLEQIRHYECMYENLMPEECDELILLLNTVIPEMK